MTLNPALTRKFPSRPSRLPRRLARWWKAVAKGTPTGTGKEAAAMTQLKWAVQLAGTAFALLALIETGRRNGWI